MFIKVPRSIRTLQMQLAAKVDISEISVHPDEDGDRDLWMFYVLFPEGRELFFYVTGREAAKKAVRDDFVVWLSTKEAV